MKTAAGTVEARLEFSIDEFEHQFLISKFEKGGLPAPYSTRPTMVMGLTLDDEELRALHNLLKAYMEGEDE